MAELLLPGDILSMTARAADRLMGAGNGDAALLYLWLLRRGGRLEPEAARRALKWDVPRLEAALSALVGLGLADGTAAPEAPARMEPEGPPEYTAADITRELEDGASSLPRPGERGAAASGQDPVHVGLEEPVHPLRLPGPAGGGDLPAGELVRGGVSAEVRPRPQAPHEPDSEGRASCGGGWGWTRPRPPRPT